MNNQNSPVKFLKIFKLRTTIICFGLVVLFLVLAPAVLALDTGLEYGTYTGLGTQDIRITVMKIVRVFLGLVGLIALIIIIYAGYLWMTSAGNPEQVDKAKRTLRNAIIGLVIIIFAFAIVSFIIAMLQEAAGGEWPEGKPPSGCENCDHLGTGIIESVYPIPFARDIARNTNIMVTFKVIMDPDSIIEGIAADLVCSGAGNSSDPCFELAGDLKDGSVKIFADDATEESALAADQVKVSTNDGRTFVFNPVDYLGNSDSNTWYAVKLTNDIKKDNGDSAFPGANNYFLWRFEIGTYLDLDPVEISNVFPVPDTEGDKYEKTESAQATGFLTVASLPQVAQEAAVFDIESPVLGEPSLSISGDYNCSEDSLEDSPVVILSDDGVTFDIISSPSIPGLNETAERSGNSVNIGCGLTLTFDSDSFYTGNRWEFKVKAAKEAEGLIIDSKRYTFVTAGASGNQIIMDIDDNTNDLAKSITEKIIADNLRVEANVDDKDRAKITLTARLAGKQGNNIPLQPEGSWATVIPMAGGGDPTFKPEVVGVVDQPRNAVITLDFNEAIDPIQANENNIEVEYRKLDSSLDVWERVAGKFLVSNQYKTVEFLPDSACIEDGKPIVNSCGDIIYCLPFNKGMCRDADIKVAPTSVFCDSDLDCPDDYTCEYEATRYRITVKAAELKECNEGVCVDANFSNCSALAGEGKACQGVEAFYPEAKDPPKGIIDAANNSFNGNKNTYVLSNKIYGKAEGPESQSGNSPFALNKVCFNDPSTYCLGSFDCAGNDCLNLPESQGDDLVWSFYINKDVKLEPSIIAKIGPIIGESGVSLTMPVESTFDGMMMSSTLKPGSNYRDGRCYCDSTNLECPNGQVCDINSERCKPEPGAEIQYCLEDDDCPSNDPDKQCLTRKYVTLIDLSTARVGWWVGKENLDTVVPYDGYADQTMAVLDHTKFAEVTNYGSEMGSGIMDIYQNCFLPSAGPPIGPAEGKKGVCSLPEIPTILTPCGADSDCGKEGEYCICPVDDDHPYCCDGRAMNEDAWKESKCFTGF